MADNPPSTEHREPGPGELAFDYIKAPDFRSVYIDGAMGSVTPSGKIHVAMYVERSAIPTRQIYAFDADTGQVNGPVRTFDRNAVVREVSCDVIVDVGIAREIALLLLRLVNSADTSADTHE
jgi:hypothetical protein